MQGRFGMPPTLDRSRRIERKAYRPSDKVIAALAAGACAVAASPAGAQATASAFIAANGIPQPHFVEARRIASEINFWKVPILNTCYQDDAALAQVIIKDPAPTKVLDNLYFVGMGGVSAWAVQTSDGIILIDTLNTTAEATQHIEGGLRSLGVDPAQIKVILISHGHADHYGGAKYLQEKYGSKVYMSEPDWPLAEERARQETRGRGPPPPRDGVLKDGDPVTLGDTTIKTFFTPGHTPGSLGLIIPVNDKGTPHKLLFLGGITSANLSPENHVNYANWIAKVSATVEREGIDGYIAPHSNYDDVAMKVIHVNRPRPNEPNPFIVGRDDVHRWVDIMRECNLNNRDVEAVFAARRRAGVPSR